MPAKDPDYGKKYYEQNRGKRLAYNKEYNDTHKQETSEQCKKRRQGRKALGLCTACGIVNAISKKTLCNSCRDETNNYKKTRKANLKALGLCINCGKPINTQSRVYCNVCADKSNNQQNASKQKQRLIAIAILGGKCVSCGEADPVILEFDHIYNNGKKCRDLGGGGAAIASFAIKNKDNPVLLAELLAVIQLLCAKCHAYKTRKWQRKELQNV
jgi:hypothetical protein